MSAAPKVGALTIDEFIELWKSVTDETYWRPLVEAGEGKGFEVITQAAAQFVRLSQSIDRSTQALYVLPWSGQSDLPAAGGSFATTTLTLSRSLQINIPITITAGAILFEENINDFGTNGPELVATGREYVALETKTFGPWETGPLSILVSSTRQGYADNNAAIGGINQILQPGAALANTKASIVAGTSAHRLVVREIPDVVTPDLVGQYIKINSAASSPTINDGQIRRVIGYESPIPGTNGGTALLAPTEVFVVSSITGAFQFGETVTQASSGARGIFFHNAGGDKLVIDNTFGTFTTGAIVGSLSGATATIGVILQSDAMVNETGTVTWTVLDWDSDLGITVTNAAQPTGGQDASLDSLGDEKKIPRANGESDDDYRLRVAKVPDFVSPNAIIRNANRILAAFGGSVVLREVGTDQFPGIFFDGLAGSTDPNLAFAYDMDMLTVSGTVTGTFIEGEKILQTTGGIIAEGTAVLNYPTTVATLPAIPASPTFAGIARVFGTFVSSGSGGGPIVGQVSGATVATPAFTGGLQTIDKFKILLDWADSRAFFFLEVPRITFGDFGTFYDVTTLPANAYDASPFLSFYDGFALNSAVAYRNIWQAVERARAGGVGWQLILGDGT